MNTCTGMTRQIVGRSIELQHITIAGSAESIKCQVSRDQRTEKRKSSSRFFFQRSRSTSRLNKPVRPGRSHLLVSHCISQSRCFNKCQDEHTTATLVRGEGNTSCHSGCTLQAIHLLVISNFRIIL